ncbi:MAG: 2-amino-4-hydroxy-6-hydroxymethyldihydropteridine diphosphokinase [Acidimicrobiales bacterium]
MTLAYLGLGSNLGDRRAYLGRAVDRLRRFSGPEFRISRLYETDPVGGPDDQSNYLNLVVAVETELSAHELLEFCQSLEREAARERLVEWGPRTLDIDLLLYGDLSQDDERLVIPHPRMWERRFVLEPLSDLAPELMPPHWQDHVHEGRVWPVEDL